MITERNDIVLEVRPMPSSPMAGMPDVLVVGAGFAGAVTARELADSGFRVRVIDRRPHVGGNAWDELDAQGVLVHPYGPHIFHTNSRRVFAWLSRFTEWRFYEHRVLAFVSGRYYPIPINRTTLSLAFDVALEEGDVEGFLERVREPRAEVLSSEDVVLDAVGPRLCDMFFRGYTRKQWGVDLSELSPGVAARIPVRTNDDDRYFSDQLQFMPVRGYAALFGRMLDHPLIEVVLSRDFSEEPSRRDVRHTVYTGPIDAYFGFRHGRLPYRSLRFEHFHVSDPAQDEFVQRAPVVNYPGDDVAFTRVSEFKQITGQSVRGSSLVREFPLPEGDPYYPVPNPESEELLSRYRDDAGRTPDVTFVGRLAQYRYYNMDQVVAAALKAASDVRARLTSAGPSGTTCPASEKSACGSSS